MISLDDIQRSWLFINQSTDEERVPAQILDGIPMPSGPPLLAVDELQQRHFLIPSSGRQHHRGDQRSAGIHLFVNEWGAEEKRAWYTDLVCLKPHLNDVFDLIIYDICKDLQTSKAHPVNVCREVLDQWRELLNQDSINLPDRPTLIGIFGELYVLRDLIRRNPHAIQSWAGPYGARHDFTASGISIEVKTSQQRRSRVITIHSHDQLDAPVGGSLYLILLQVEEAFNSGESIADLVNELTAIGCNQYELFRRLARLNITQETLSRTSSMHLRLLTTNVYRVDDLFPHITASSFVGARLPDRIVSINYQLDLSSTPPYPLNSDDVTALYRSYTSTFEHEIDT